MLNVYEMYTAHGHAAGFWIRRGSWARSTFAKVLTVGGSANGPLAGRPPYHGNPTVVVDFYMDGRLKEPGMILSCPGTYTYTEIQPPNGH